MRRGVLSRQWAPGGDRRAEFGLRQAMAVEKHGKSRDLSMARGMPTLAAGGGGGGGTVGARRCHRRCWELAASSWVSGSRRARGRVGLFLSRGGGGCPGAVRSRRRRPGENGGRWHFLREAGFVPKGGDLPRGP